MTWPNLQRFPHSGTFSATQNVTPAVINIHPSHPPPSPPHPSCPLLPPPPPPQKKRHHNRKLSALLEKVRSKMLNFEFIHWIRSAYTCIIKFYFNFSEWLRLIIFNFLLLNFSLQCVCVCVFELLETKAIPYKNLFSIKKGLTKIFVH